MQLQVLHSFALNKFLKHDRGIRECARRALRGGGPPYNTILLFGYLL